MKWKKYLCSGVIFGVAVVLMAGPVAAQEDEYVLEDTVVTATKTGETLLQETSIAITVFDDQMLGDRSTFDLQDLSSFSASTDLAVTVTGVQGSIRGIGAYDVFFTADASIAFYLDGVFLFEGIGANSDFLDVERIEVLRGPQGVTWGGNATGGAVNIITKKPSDELELEVAVEVGNYSKRRVDAMISGPIIKGKMNGRLAVSDSMHDGYIDNIQSEIDSADENFHAFRGSVQILPTDSMEILIKGHYYKHKGSVEASYNTYKLKYWDSDKGRLADSLGYSKEYIIPSDFWTLNQDEDAFNETEHYGGSAEITIDLPHDITLISLTGFLTSSSVYTGQDIDNTAISEIKFPQWSDTEFNSWSQEVRLNGSWGRLDWIFGGTYIDQWDGYDDIYWKSPNPDFFELWRALAFPTSVERKGIFTNLTYAFTDRFSGTAGVRYSDESKQGEYLLGIYMVLPDDQRIVLAESRPRPSARWTAWTPRFVLDYKATEDLFLYAKAENGWRSGDTQVDNYWFNEEEGFPVDPEEIWLYEIGAKTDWFDKRLRVNAAVFKMEYDNMVTLVWLPNWLVNAQNVGSLDIKGFELEMLARPTQNLTLNGAVTYLDSEYGSFMYLNNWTGEQEDVAGNTVENVPEWKFVLGANYVLSLEGAGFLTFGTNIAYRDKSHWGIFGSDPRAWVDDHTLVNVLVRYETEDGRWSLEAYGRNIFEEEYYNHLKFQTGTDDVFGRPGNPMTMGMRVSYRY